MTLSLSLELFVTKVKIKATTIAKSLSRGGVAPLMLVVSS